MINYDKNNEYSYTLGMSITLDLLINKPHNINKIFVNNNINKTEYYDKLVLLCKNNNINIINDRKIFNKLSDKENCFVIGEFNKYKMKIESGNHLVLVNPENAGNLGTIIRSALGFGIKNIIIIKPGVDYFDPKVIRSSMGSIFNVNLIYYNSIQEYINDYPKNNLYPFMLKAKTKLNYLKFLKPFTLIFGPESSGLDDSYLELGTPVVITHNNLIDSLNLPIALSIALYEATKDNYQ